MQGNFYLYPLTGPASSTDNAIATYKGTGGRAVQNSSVTVNSGTLRAANGTAGAPAYSFGSDTTEGFYRVGSSQIGLSFLGTGRIFFNDSGSNPYISGLGGGNIQFGSAGSVILTALGTNQSITLTPSGTGSVQTIGGAVGTPSYSFTSDSDTGLFNPNPNEVGFVAAGTAVFNATASGVRMLQGLFKGANNGNVLLFSDAGGTADYVQIENTNAGGSTTISAVGGSSNITINLTPKGSGIIDTTNTSLNIGGGKLFTGGTGGGWLNGTSGAVNLTAAGTNQNITLTPSGTGASVFQNATSKASILEFASDGYARIFLGASATTPTTSNVFVSSNGSSVFVNGSGALTLQQNGGLRIELQSTYIGMGSVPVLMNGLSTVGTGVLQFPVGAADNTSGISLGGGRQFFYSISPSTTVFRGAGTTTQFVLDTTGAAVASAIIFNSNNTNKWDIGYAAGSGSGTAFEIYNRVTSANAVSIASASSNVTLAGLIASYNGIATAGNGVVSVQAAGRATAQTGANASVSTYTVGAADASFEVSANILVTTATTHAFTCTCAYTDEGNTARTITFTFSNVGGTLLTSIANTGGTVPYEGVPLHIRAKASTSITIATTGTFTSVVYNVEGNIRKLA